MSNAFSLSTKNMSEMVAISKVNYDILVQLVNEVIGNGGPSGVFDTLQELKDRHPKGAKGVYLVTADGKWYYWNNAWLAGGVYQATQLSDGSVTEVKLEIGLREKIDSIEGIGEAAERANTDLTNHKNSSQAHNAAAIVYSGNVPGVNNTKQAIDSVQSQINNESQRISYILAHNGDGTKDSELIDARGGYIVLGDRLNGINEQISEISANVKSYGAKGDGVTNDTLAIQRALDTGKNVFIPDGEYLISDSLYIRTAGQRIEGSSKQNAIIKQTNNSKDAIVVENGYDVTITSLNIRGIVNTTANRTSGISIYKGVRGNFHNNTINGFAFGISNENATEAWILDITNNNIEYCTLACVYVPKNSHATRLRANELRASKYGIVAGVIKEDGTIDETYNNVGAGSLSIRDNTIEGNRDIDIVIGNGNFSVDINGNYFETALNQNAKKWYIQVGTLGNGRAIGVRIDKNYFYTYPDYATNFPVIKLFRFSYLSVTNNESLSLNQVLIDTSQAAASGNVVEKNNYANGGKLISDVNAAVSMTSSVYPLTKNGGYREVVYVWDSATQTYVIGETFPNRKTDVKEINTPLFFGSKKLSVSNSKIDAIGTTYTLHKNSTTVFQTSDYLIIHFHIDITLNANASVYLYLADYLPAGKKLYYDSTGSNFLSTVSISTTETAKAQVYSADTIRVNMPDNTNLIAGKKVIMGSVFIPLVI